MGRTPSFRDVPYSCHRSACVGSRFVGCRPTIAPPRCECRSGNKATHSQNEDGLPGSAAHVDYTQPNAELLRRFACRGASVSFESVAVSVDKLLLLADGAT